MPIGPETAKARAKLAITTLHHPDADLEALQGELRIAKRADHIARVVAEAPPLTEAHIARLRALLGGEGP